MKSKCLKGLLAAALLGGAVNSFAVGLAENAAKFVGNITTNGQVRSDFGQYWNQITAENECKWASIEGSRGNYNFSGCKRAYDWAKQNGGHFKFHALVWGSQYPNWLGSLSVDETKKAITAWFDAVQKQFPDLEMIDVVNEAIRTGNNQYHSGYPNTKIIQALGGDNNGDYAFVTTAFKMARERWPKAILIYNDYNTVQWNKDQGIQLIQTIKKNGAPVDAYGLQAHDMMSQGGGAGGTGGGGSCLSINTLKSVLKEIWDKTQTPMFISEYDIASTNDNVQKQCYEEQITHFMENEHVAGITIWGYIYGSTWLDCNGTARGCSGIIKDGRDRAAMTWLKQYLASNTCVNTTGLETGIITPVDPEPQLPFKGEALAVPGKIEVEDFDIPGKGKNEDGSSNESYSDDSENHGDSDYRKGTGADLYKKATGVALGYNQEGDWYEWTIDVKKAGDYTVFASVATENSTSSFSLSIDGKVAVEKVALSGTSFDDFSNVKANITLPEGKHVLRMDVTGSWFDIDYFNFVEGKDAKEPGSEEDPPISIQPQIQYQAPRIGSYDVFDANGVRLGRMNAYSMSEAAQILKSSSDVKNNGIYMLRSVQNGAVKSVRISR